MTFVALWRLSHYDICRIMTFVALWRLSFMTFVALCLLPIMTFVAYRVCRSIVARYWINSVSQTAATTVAFSSVSILFLINWPKTGQAVYRRHQLGLTDMWRAGPQAYVTVNIQTSLSVVVGLIPMHARPSICLEAYILHLYRLNGRAKNPHRQLGALLHKT